jgi:cytidyltransferase-like protein
MSVGYLTDSFDLINVRDLDVIAQARSLCSRLVVGVFSDEYAEQLSGRRPVVPLVERVAVLRHVRGVADVVVHTADTPPPAHGWVNLAIADTLAPVVEGSIIITPRRESDSLVLRNALCPVDDEAVA